MLKFRGSLYYLNAPLAEKFSKETMPYVKVL